MNTSFGVTHPPGPRLAARVAAGLARVVMLAGALLGANGAIGEPATPAGAVVTFTAGPNDPLAQQVQRLVRDSTLAASGSGNASGRPRVEVTVGQLDARLRLAPCERVEPHLPEGTQLWGRSRIGVRCLQGAVKWNVYLPVTVKVFGPALTARNANMAGASLGAGDLIVGEVDLAEDASPAIAAAGWVEGRTLARSVKAGQSLRVSHFKPRQWFAAGDTVTVVGRGDGFQVAGQAEALGPGTEGLPVRLRTEGGKLLTGMPVGARRAELAL